MQDIANAVGLSRPALYHHFENKQQILAALVEDITLHSARETERIAAQANDSDPRRILQDAVEAYAASILAKPELFAVLLREERNLPGHIRALQAKGKRDLLDSFTRLLRKGMDAGVFRDIDPAFTALCIFGMCNWTIEWFQPGGRIKQDQAAAKIAGLCLAMVQRPAGGGALESTDALGWLDLLRDDLAHLEKAVRKSPANPDKTSNTRRKT